MPLIFIEASPWELSEVIFTSPSLIEELSEVGINPPLLTERRRPQ
jgi:hypothetical protein